ncbi:hypothetical protein sscle_10g078080 [Sclerotinia sclerotiorum 1980 UF-70]|uniref:Uncharacterized protein n=1 Tax=Sclerotinia sclerotiorum (strain ATCC 18683 / 1980 / Ss-1) TaxID=665079 RepID=A0A1D9QDR8_SCLS1|nr:hypothetical protein sscle_10g078080 [Sclerotinia sclerotiorum 1980 UF-70]
MLHLAKLILWLFTASSAIIFQTTDAYQDRYSREGLAQSTKSKETATTIHAYPPSSLQKLVNNMQENYPRLPPAPENFLIIMMVGTWIFWLGTYRAALELWGISFVKETLRGMFGRARNTTRTFRDPDLQKWWDIWVGSSTPAFGTMRSRNNSPEDTGTRITVSNGVWKVLKDGGFWKKVLKSFITDVFWGIFLFYWNLFVIWRDAWALFCESIWCCLVECFELHPDGSYSIVLRRISRRG